jgi:type I restriction enzyme M protein
VAFTLADIIQNSDYSLKIFRPEELTALEIFDKNGKPYLRDFLDSKKERMAKPEEVVRQLYLYRLLNRYGYPASRIAVEKGIWFGSNISEKRADIVIHDEKNPQEVYIVVECKKPKRKDGLEQLKSYCNATNAAAAVWTNGGEEIILHRANRNDYESLSDLPTATQKISDVVTHRTSIEELATINKLVTQKWTLKKIIQDLENLVLANAGVDAFEEVFKLIYAKLFDESEARKRKGRVVEFRIYGDSDSQVHERISGLFEEAKKKWPGVFLTGDRIDLLPDALRTCVSFLQDIKLFNSNLQVIDDAFEYLTVKIAKGDKGQYFTPRYVIDMCVKMLNPRDGEHVIDTAAGSCGFTVHTMFHVWGGELTSEGPTREQADYAAEYVYGLDFDPRSIKVARALNLIAGDGRTNVYRVNTLAPHTWDEEARVALRKRLRQFPDKQRNDDNADRFREFDFDIVMTNPPFAGDISDSRILHQYELAKQAKGIDIEKLEDEEEREKYADHPFRTVFQDSGKWGERQSRDILFVERNLQFLKPGGRMAIVLPQGRFNNVSDARVRSYVAEYARILAVVGLHGNTFKPNTGTKTSVLFLQKWNDDPASKTYNPRRDDYPIFFATSERGGKDNSGEYIYLNDNDGEKLLDLFGHEIVDQDLYDTRRVLAQQLERLRRRDASNPELIAVHEEKLRDLLTQLPQHPTIAEAFEEFARRQNLTFAPEED